MIINLGRKKSGKILDHAEMLLSFALDQKVSLKLSKFSKDKHFCGIQRHSQKLRDCSSRTLKYPSAQLGKKDLPSVIVSIPRLVALKSFPRVSGPDSKLS